jgi:predicted transcriptional regulator
MTIREIRDILEADVLTGECHIEKEVHSACGSDMMSDVLAYVKDQSVLLTGLVNPQVVRTAEMMDMRCVVFVRGKMPDEDIVRLAQELGIVLMCTPHRMFTSCGLLYSSGLKGSGLKSE